MITHLRNQVKCVLKYRGHILVTFQQFTDPLCGFMSHSRWSSVALMMNKMVNPSLKSLFLKIPHLYIIGLVPSNLATLYVKCFGSD